MSGFVHRIFRACSSWEHINDSLQKAKKIMECNQYLPTFYDPIIKETIHSILTEGKKTNKESISNTEISDTIAKRPLFIQYRGKVTEQFAKNLHKCKAPCTLIMTMRKLKSVLPSLKPETEEWSSLSYKMCRL